MDLVGKRKWFFLISLLVILPGVVALVIPPTLRAGIDFSGGSAMSLEFVERVSVERVRSELVALGHPEAVIQGLGSLGYFIRTTTLKQAQVDAQNNIVVPAERDAIKEALESNLSPIRTFEFDSVSPVVARQTVRNAIIAVIVASVAILFFVTWAFRHVPNPFRYGVCAIVALIHDVLVVVGVFSILGKVMEMEVNAMFITGMLTVIGYSVNDTIVVFDRIRENVARNPGADLATTVNTSLLESLGRSLNTSLTLFFVILALLLFGGSSIQNLLLVMLIGVVVGTYSSIAIAAQLLVVWEKGEFGRLMRRLRLARAR